MIHVTHVSHAYASYEWVMAHIWIWMSHGTHINMNIWIWISHIVQYEWFMWHIWMNHVTHVKESCHNVSCHANAWVMSHICMSHDTHMNESCHTCVTHLIHTSTFCCTGWRRCIGCLKLQVIFRRRPTHYRALLREMTNKDKASYGSSPPCNAPVTYEGVMSHIWMSHVIHMNESCHTYEWVMPHINESCHIWMVHATYEWVVPHMNESCHIWMSRAAW